MRLLAPPQEMMLFSPFSFLIMMAWPVLEKVLLMKSVLIRSSLHSTNIRLTILLFLYFGLSYSRPRRCQSVRRNKQRFRVFLQRLPDLIPGKDEDFVCIYVTFPPSL